MSFDDKLLIHEPTGYVNRETLFRCICTIIYYTETGHPPPIETSTKAAFFVVETAIRGQAAAMTKLHALF